MQISKHITSGVLFLALSLPVSLLAETRGYSNNNPGNIIKTSTEWLGKVECSDKKFECFDSMEKGIRALALVLNSYYFKHGLRDNDEIIERFVGRQDRSKSAYILYIVGNSSGNCNKRHNRVVEQLITSIIHFENGYTKEGLEISRIVNETLPDMADKEWRCICLIRK